MMFHEKTRRPFGEGALKSLLSCFSVISVISVPSVAKFGVCK